MFKQLMIVTLATLGMSQLGHAAACVSGSLSAYIGLGATGCSIGSSNLYNFRLVSGSAGATTIPSANVTLTPIGGVNFGLSSMVDVTSAAGTVRELLFGFQVGGASYTGTSATLSASSESGDGAVTGLVNYCAGGGFGPDGFSGCMGVTNGLATVDGFQNVDSATFAAVNLLSITNDLTIDGGLGGSASGGTFTNRFTTAAVPEPMSICLTGIGLALALGTRFKFTRK